MEPSIYNFSLCTALPLMLFFGFYFLFAKTPEKKIFKNYLRSRQMMGIAMLLLSAKFFGPFLFWYPIQKCGFCHIDEHVHILPVLFSVQFGIDNVA